MKQKPLTQSVSYLFCLTFFCMLLVAKSGTTNAQNSNLDYKTLFADAEYFFLYHDYQEALPLYLRALEKMPNSANLNYRIGQCYLNIAGLKAKAIPYFQMAENHMYAGYQEGSNKEMKAPMEVLYFLGEAYRAAGMIDEALDYYSRFKAVHDTKKSIIDPNFVDQQIASCERAKIMMKQGLYIKEEVLPVYDDGSYLLTPAISADGKTLVFTRQEKFYDAIYIAELQENGQWGEPVNITLDLAVEGNVYSTSINSDGTQIFLFKNDKDVGNIYSANKVDGKWGKAQKLGRSVNTRYWETFASISPDGQTLYFSSNRSGGHGAIDLYYSNLLEDGTWGTAVNLGATVNTLFNEEAPYLTPDGNTLFFISQGHNSMGGYDVFYSERLDNNEWSTPTNLGYPINTTDDNMMFYPLGNNEALVTYVKKDEPATRKIRQISYSKDPDFISVPIAGTIALDNEPIYADAITIEIVNQETKQPVAQLNAQEKTGNFKAKLLPGNYLIKANANGFIPNEQSIVIPENSWEEIPVSIMLKRSKLAPQHFAIGPVLFDFDRYEVKSEAKVELDKLVAFIQTNPDLTIEVCGHTDSKGSLEYNKKLSLKRANAAISYMTSKGIGKDKLVAKGVGPTEEIALNTLPNGNDCPEGRRLNRRISIKTISSDKGTEVLSKIDVPNHLKP